MRARHIGVVKRSYHAFILYCQVSERIRRTTGRCRPVSEVTIEGWVSVCEQLSAYARRRLTGNSLPIVVHPVAVAEAAVAVHWHARTEPRPQALLQLLG